MKLDLIIQTEEHAVDMKTGLETISGASEAVRSVVEAVITDKVSQRNTSANKVRNKMMESFEGSYGLVFEVGTEDPELKAKLSRIGNETMSQVIGYFISEALYLECPPLSVAASQLIREVSAETQGILIDKLRRSPLQNAVSVPSSYGHNVVLKTHTGEFERRDIITLSQSSKTNLSPKTNKEVIHFRACITRLNINTGNGRLLIEGESETVAFGFPSAYREVRVAARKRFSENLDKNNGVSSDKWEYIDIVATSLRLKSGHIIKYLISGFE
ncbi:conserved hypothetical protein [Vibrio crassostreae]|nr:conserved hypothetical protein [Vibrio crassostreae]CAK2130780.1 conserved hypothetical protein [Vibrio crassostreae]CAK2987326.1 conserved hypothetical protein [Vibrio crassostreae]CAK3505178.1 conserved hypothetical protein [Vibrio crassostreae]CAK3969410.1 conserved hypothetical protein [Vibrio crassostreae]